MSPQEAAQHTIAILRERLEHALADEAHAWKEYAYSLPHQRADRTRTHQAAQAQRHTTEQDLAAAQVHQRRLARQQLHNEHTA